MFSRNLRPHWSHSGRGRIGGNYLRWVGRGWLGFILTSRNLLSWPTSLTRMGSFGMGSSMTVSLAAFKVEPGKLAQEPKMTTPADIPNNDMPPLIPPACLRRMSVRPVRYLGSRVNQHWLVESDGRHLVLRGYAKEQS